MDVPLAVVEYAVPRARFGERSDVLLFSRSEVCLQSDVVTSVQSGVKRQSGLVCMNQSAGQALLC